jgi:beta-glucosidase
VGAHRAARGAWTAPDSVDLFARYCDRAARHMAGSIGYATTFNEPNSFNMFAGIFPPQFVAALGAMNAAATQACGSANFKNPMFPEPADAAIVQTRLFAAHKAGRTAIKAARGALPVGVTLAIVDDQAVGKNSLQDAKRKAFDGDWLEAAKGDDFLGVQNYGRTPARRRCPAAKPPTARPTSSIRCRWSTRCATPTRPAAFRSWSPSRGSARTTTRSGPG